MALTTKMSNLFKKHVEYVCSLYNITEAIYYSRLSPEFDIKQTGEHSTELVLIEGKEIPIDTLLVPLVARLNILVDGLTNFSCQHDLWGWASISFDAVKYKTFCDKVLEKVKQKYLDISIVKNHSLVRRLSFNTLWQKNPGFSVDNDIYANTVHFKFSVNLLFPQSQIKVFESELDELFG
jgi:hypothetical protein